MKIVFIILAFIYVILAASCQPIMLEKLCEVLEEQTKNKALSIIVPLLILVLTQIFICFGFFYAAGL